MNQPANKRFEKLFSPLQIGKLRFKNRMVAPAVTSGTASREGYVTGQTLDLYEAMAKGGVGAIVVEVTSIDFPAGKVVPRQIAACDDKFVPGLRELNQVMKKHGAVTLLQLSHGGIISKQAFTGLQPVGPSVVIRPVIRSQGGEVPRELSLAEIADLIDKHAQAARRTAQAGFDAIEFHAGHVHLISQFLSRAWNKRQDRYGGPLENRARFLLEILEATQKLIGKDYPLWCRINGEEIAVPDGITLDEAKDTARLLEKAGITVVDVSASGLDLVSAAPSYYRPGWAVRYAEGVKSVVSVPVMAVGRLTPQVAEEVLQSNQADLIAIGRPLRTDQEFPSKVAAGNFEDIRPCIACNICGKQFRSTGERPCSVNAAFGREGEYRITPAKEKKRVLVVGGGPAGMEAATVLAQRGHDVTLCEKTGKLGGQLLLAAAPPFKSEIKDFANYQARQIKKLKVKIELNTEATPDSVQRLRPDVVIVAAGATPFIPSIPGVSQTNVVTAWDVLSGQARVGNSVVILGGGRVGCETAEVLAEAGKKVSIVEMLNALAPDMAPLEGRTILLKILAGKGVEMLTQVNGEEITGIGLVISDSSGQRRTLSADTVVLACGSKPENALAEKLKGTPAQVHLIGDCVKPRGILEAVDEAALIGRKV